MQNLNEDGDSIVYECMLLVSLFVLRNVKNEKIKQILQKNAEQLINFVDNFHLHEGRDEEECDDFSAVKDKILSKLRRMQIQEAAMSLLGREF